MKKLDTKGFSAVELVLVVIVIGLIGGVGYYIMQQNKADQPAPTATETKVGTGETLKTKTFSDPTNTYSLAYPEKWTLEQTDVSPATGPTWLNKTADFIPDDVPRSKDTNKPLTRVSVTGTKSGDPEKSLKDAGYSGNDLVVTKKDGKTIAYDKNITDAYTDHSYVVSDGKHSVYITFREKQAQNSGNDATEAEAEAFDASSTLPELRAIVDSVKFL